jgi:hypothetical protein
MTERAGPGCADARDLNAAVCRGAAGDGVDLLRVQVEREPGRAEAGEEALKELLERRFDDVDLLVIYIDGMMFGEHHVRSAVGVDRGGHKHVLGIQPGATEKCSRG